MKMAIFLLTFFFAFEFIYLFIYFHSRDKFFSPVKWAIIINNSLYYYECDKTLFWFWIFICVKNERKKQTNSIHTIGLDLSFAIFWNAWCDARWIAARVVIEKKKPHTHTLSNDGDGDKEMWDVIILRFNCEHVKIVITHNLVCVKWQVTSTEYTHIKWIIQSLAALNHIHIEHIHFYNTKMIIRVDK